MTEALIKPVCVRISELPEDVDDEELKNWLSNLEFTRTRRHIEDQIALASEYVAPNLMQLNLAIAADGAGKQATATFTKLPIIFQNTKEDVLIDHPSWQDAVADTHFGGLTVLFTPPPGTGITADIVAVSGLGGHALGSWGSPVHNKVWLRDFLPADVKGVRVLLWGYNTSIAPGTDPNWKEQYSTLANTLLHNLKDARRGVDKLRPIVFLGHSLGGLVIEKALVMAHDYRLKDEILQDIFNSTAGILLFGVPHEGIRFWELVSAVVGTRSEAFVRNLQTDEDTEASEVLGMHIESVQRIMENRKFSVICYWEKDHSKVPTAFQQEGQTDASRLLVTKRSALGVGIILDPLKALGLNGNHRSMVKFKTKNDEGYKSVRNSVKDAIEKYQQIKETLFDPLDLGPLEFKDMNCREREIKEAYNTTCQWVFQHQSYKRWIANGRGILGIRGKPGSGKSTLLKRIYQNFLSSGDNTKIRLAFFYHRRGAPIQYSQHGMYRTLLHQLLSQVASAGDKFRMLVEEQKRWQHPENWQWQLEDLQLAFSDALLRAAASHKIYLFLDALDEAGQEAAEEVVSYIREISKKLCLQGAYVSICFSCRHFPILATKEDFEVHVDQYNREDIWTYISSNLKETLIFNGRCEDKNIVLKSLRQMIFGRASNVFMWVVLIVPLCVRKWNGGYGMDEIEQVVNQVPRHLWDTYRYILTSVIERDTISETLHILQWILLAKRPLSVPELRFALAADNDESLQEEWHKEADQRNAQMQIQINSLTGGLAEVKFDHLGNSTVQFVHQSVVDFLMQNKFDGLQVNSSRDAIGEGRDRLIQSCLNFLKFKSNLSAYRSMRDLGEYAGRYCLAHAQEAERQGQSQKDLVMKCEWPSTKIVSYFSAPPAVQKLKNKGTNLLHFAASWNLNTVVSELIRRGIDLEEADDYGKTAMHYAMACDYGDVLETLITAKALCFPDTGERTPLIMAVELQNGFAVKRLLNSSTNVYINEKKNEQCQRAMRYAVDQNLTDMAKLLVEGGTNVNAQWGKLGNALQTAVINQLEPRPLEMVKLLLDLGADINAQGGIYGNALTAAVHRGPIRGSMGLMRLLLDAGADFNAQGGTYGNALAAAVHIGSMTSIRFLLNAGADVNLPGGQWGTALQIARLKLNGAEYLKDVALLERREPNIAKRKAIVQCLLDAGAKEMDPFAEVERALSEELDMAKPKRNMKKERGYRSTCLDAGWVSEISSDEDIEDA